MTDSAFDEIADFLHSQKIDHHPKELLVTVDLQTKAKKKEGYYIFKNIRMSF